MKLSAKKGAAPQSVIVFGPPKSGKTKLVGMLAEKFNLMWIDIEKGYATLFTLPQEWQDRIELVALPDSPQWPIGIETALKIASGKPCWIDNATGKVVDEKLKKADQEYTFVNLSSLDSSWVVVWDSGTQLTQSAISHITKNRPEDYKLEFDDWGALQKLMEKFFSYIQTAQYHTVVITHEVEVEMEDGKMKIVPAAGSSKFARNVARYFGHVVYTQLNNKQHKAMSSTVAINNVITGSRTNVETEKMVNGASLIPIFESEALTNQSNGQKAMGQLQQLVRKPA